MSRFEGDFTAAAAARLTMTELIELAQGQDGDPLARQQAIACCLSAGEGWREALKALGGSFAGGAAKREGLSDGNPG